MPGRGSLRAPGAAAPAHAPLSNSARRQAHRHGLAWVTVTAVTGAINILGGGTTRCKMQNILCVKVVQARSPGCPSRHEPARSQGFQIPADNFPNELARVCDSVGKSPAWRGLDAAFPSHFVVLCVCPLISRTRAGSCDAAGWTVSLTRLGRSRSNLKFEAGIRVGLAQPTEAPSEAPELPPSPSGPALSVPVYQTR